MKTIFYLIIISILGLTGYEWFLRLSPFGGNRAVVQYDADLGAWHIPNLHGKYNQKCMQAEFAFDEKGLVKSQRPYNPHQKDILLLGDSFIEALMIPTGQTIHHRLEQHFQNYNVLNYAISGTSPTQQLVLLHKKANTNNAAPAVQFVYLNNDILDVLPSRFDATNRPKVAVTFKGLTHYTVIPPALYSRKEQLRDILSQLELFSFARRIWYYLTYTGETKGNFKTPQEEARTLATDNHWLQLQGALLTMNHELAAKNIKHVVVIYSEIPAFQEKLSQFLNQQKIENLQLSNYFQAHNIAIKDTHFTCDAHRNAYGHQKISEIVTQKIQDMLH